MNCTIDDIFSVSATFVPNVGAKHFQKVMRLRDSCTEHIKLMRSVNKRLLTYCRLVATPPCTGKSGFRNRLLNK